MAAVGGMRLLTVFAAALICASACDRTSLDGGSTSAGGASGATASGAGATDPIGGSGGPAGEQAGDTHAGACACDSQAPECQPVLMTACLGQHCPPSVDDASLVSSWSLGSASGPA